MTLDTIILVILLPVAALSGWYIASRSYKKTDTGSSKSLSQYFIGLNYLLQERPDKAIEVFVKMVEVDSDTVETHLALGSLFRQRGEVDRAIRIHQNIIARPTLSKEQTASAVFELATDFKKAGLHDRAEQLFQQLANDKVFGIRSLRNLIKISQTEKEWGSAINYSIQLYKKGDKQIAVNLANYFCEQAEEYEYNKEFRSARSSLLKALEYNPKSIRSQIKLSEVAFKQNKVKEGIYRLEEALLIDPSYISVLIKLLQGVDFKDNKEILAFVEKCVKESPDSSAAVLELAAQYSKNGEKVIAMGILVDFIQDNPSINVLFELLKNYDSKLSSEDIAAIIGKCIPSDESYSCNKCGYHVSSLKWKCPSCQSWDCIKPDWYI